jgi:hypothetical protein
MQIKFISTPSTRLGPLRKLLAIIATAALVTLVLMFSAVMLVVVLLGGSLAWLYLWWKTRALRKQMRDFASAEAHGGLRGDDVVKGMVIEGEVTRVDVS